jgi:hypothetical protein
MDPRGFRADRGFSYQKLERIARGQRGKLALGVALDTALPCLDIFERLDEISVETRQGPVPLDFSVADLPVNVEGQTRYDSDAKKIVVELSDRTYRALERDDPRARVTVGHEIGHAYLHADLLLRWGTIPFHEVRLFRLAAPLHPHYLDTEWQANSFGIALLMPARGIMMLERRLGRLSEHDLRKAFGVSREAARIRLVHYQQKKAELI